MQSKKQFTTTSEEYLRSQGYTYFAFISYKREDERWAKWLKKRLQSYKLPTKTCELHSELPRKISPVFLDKDNMTPGHLANQEKSEVQSAKYIIVICSKCACNDSKNLDDEIRFFVEGGAEPSRIIPFIVDESENPVDECFPLYLQELCQNPESNIIGANVYDSGKRNAFLKVVAYMLGIKLVELENEDNRRRKKRILIKVILAIVLVVAGILFWHYVIPKKSYYLDYTTKRGEPVGICKLSKEDTESLSEHYVIVRQFGKIKELMLQDSYGNTIDSFLLERKDRPVHVKYYYEKGKNLKKLTFYDSVGNPLNTLEYSDLEHKSLGINNYSGQSAEGYGTSASLSSHSIGYFNNDLYDEDYDKKSNISRYLIEYDDDTGFVKEVRYARNDDNEIGNDSDGVYGIRFKRDELGRVKEEQYLKYTGSSGMALDSDEFECIGEKDEIAIVKYDYDGFDCVKMSFFNADDEPTAGGNFASSSVTHFYNHNPVKIEFFDEKGQPVLTNEKFASLTASHKSDGHIRTLELFGTKGERVNCYLGYSYCVFDYNFGLISEGLISKIKYYGTDNVMTVVNDLGCPIVKYKYDIHGNCKRITCCAPDESLMKSIYGYSEKRLKYKNHKIIFEKNLDEKREPTKITGGYSSVKYKYDANNHQTNILFLNKNNSICENDDGIAEIRKKYDGSGNMLEVSYHNSKGKLVELEEGYARQKLSYDVSGNPIKVVNYGINNKLVNPTESGAYKISKYDERNNEIETIYLDADKKPYITSDGYASCKNEYDNKNNLLQVSFYDANEQPVLCNEGYASKKLTYDKHKNLLKEEYFDTNGKPTLCKSGYAYIENEYDERDNHTRESYFDENRKLVNTDFGLAESRCSYNEKHDITSLYFYDEQGNYAIYLKKGFAGFKVKYNRIGQATEQIYYDEKGNVIELPEDE